MAMYQMVAQWVTINDTTKDLYMPLIDATYVLMNEVCILLKMDMEYVLDMWEKAEFQPEKAVEMIIKERFIEVEEQ